MYEIDFYEDAQGNSPVLALIEALEEKADHGDKYAKVQVNRILRQLDRLEEVGTRGSSNMVKYIGDDIWELRPGFNRILFFAWNGNRFVLLHQFRKTTDKTPKQEIESAKKRKQDWIKRQG